MAQSIIPDCLSMRRSTNHPPRDSVNVFVFSNAGSGGHRIKIRVDMLAVEGMMNNSDTIAVLREAIN